GLAADADARLVAAAHPPRQPAGEHEPERQWRGRHRASPQARARGDDTSARRLRAASIIVHRGLAPVPGALLLDEFEVLIEHDALLARERDETLAARATHERQVRLARQFDAPGSETRARDQDRDAHAHGLDYHFRGQAAGGVENLVVGGD